MPETETPTKASRLVEDLTKIPNIVASLGLSVAAAQKAFNLDYLDAMERVIVLAKILLHSEKKLVDGKPVDVSEAEQAARAEFAGTIQDLLKSMAPSRYQFTETNLRVRLDLAQTMDVGASVGLGVGFGGLAINAAFTIGYGYDYRAAAEVNTVIHAIPADPTVFSALLGRADKLSATALELPAGAEVDGKIFEQNQAIIEKLAGFKPAPTPPKSE